MTSREVSLLVWAVLGAVLVTYQIVAARSGGRFPGLGTFVAQLTTNRVGRVLFVLLWMWLGWHAFAR